MILDKMRSPLELGFLCINKSFGFKLPKTSFWAPDLKYDCFFDKTCHKASPYFQNWMIFGKAMSFDYQKTIKKTTNNTFYGASRYVSF